MLGKDGFSSLLDNCKKERLMTTSAFNTSSTDNIGEEFNNSGGTSDRNEIPTIITPTSTNLVSIPMAVVMGEISCLQVENEEEDVVKIATSKQGAIDDALLLSKGNTHFS